MTHLEAVTDIAARLGYEKARHLLDDSEHLGRFKDGYDALWDAYKTSGGVGWCVKTNLPGRRA